MNAKWFILTPVLFLIVGSGWATPQSSYQMQRQTAPTREDTNTVLKQIRTGLADLKHEINNHEEEIRTFDEKLQNQEISHEQLRQQLTEDVQSQKDYLKASTINLDGKIETLEQSVNTLEKLVNGLSADLRQIKAQANESIAVLGQHKEKLTEFEKLLETQSLHMKNLESALHSVIDVFQAKQSGSSIVDNGKSTYKVQPGDTLEKIAGAKKVTVQSIRDANQLIGDRIIVGQTLKIPSSQ